MRVFIFILAILVYVNCRPEPPITGYNYPNPAVGFGTGSLPLGSNLHGGLTYTEESSSQSTSLSNQDSYNNFVSSYDSSNYNSVGNRIHLQSDFQSSANSVSNQANNNNVQVFKHFYYHVAPEEPEEVKPRINIPTAPPQKHYKIIFIKAPSYQSSATSIVAPQQQIEEKTLVYVLVKKPEDQENIVLPTVPPTKPSKPEVYFIKYKAEKEQASSGSNLQNSGFKPEISENFNSTSFSDSSTAGLSTIYGPPKQTYGPY